MDESKERVQEIMTAFMVAYSTACLSETLSQSVEAKIEQVMPVVKRPPPAATRSLHEEAEKLAEDASSTIVAAELFGSSIVDDFDSSQYIAYDASAALIRPTGSLIAGTQTRFKRLLKMKEEVASEHAQVTLPNFPGKKWFGNLKPEFVAERFKGLQTYTKAVSTSAAANSAPVLHAFSLEADPKKVLQRAIFESALQSTIEDCKIKYSGDTAKFPDEGDALADVVLSAVRTECFPKLESAAEKKARGIGVVSRMLAGSTKKALSQFVGKSVSASWSAAQDKIKAAQEQVTGPLKSQTDAVIGKVLDKLLPVILKKLNKEEAAKKEDGKDGGEAKEAKEAKIEIKLENLPAAKALLTALQGEKPAAPAAEALKKEAATFSKNLRKRVQKESKELIKVGAGGDKSLKASLERLADVVVGLVDVWESQSTFFCEAFVPLLRARDSIDQALSEATSSEEAITKGQAASQAAADQLKDELREVGLKLGRNLSTTRQSLAKRFAALPAEVTAPVLTLPAVLAGVQLDAVSLAFIRFKSAVAQVVAPDAKLTAVPDLRAAARSAMASALVAPADDMIKLVWFETSQALKSAARELFVDEAFKVVAEGLKEVEGEVSSLVPEQLTSSGLDPKALTELIAKKILKSLADAALKQAQSRLEQAVFVPVEGEEAAAPADGPAAPSSEAH